MGRISTHRRVMRGLGGERVRQDGWAPTLPHRLDGSAVVIPDIVNRAQYEPDGARLYGCLAARSREVVQLAVRAPFRGHPQRSGTESAREMAKGSGGNDGRPSLMSASTGIVLREVM